MGQLKKLHHDDIENGMLDLPTRPDKDNSYCEDYDHFVDQRQKDDREFQIKEDAKDECI